MSYLESRETSGSLNFLNLFGEPEVWICKNKDASLEAEACSGGSHLSPAGRGGGHRA